MISGLQHLSFCERQWALIHIEQAWGENRFTAEGQNLHQRVHADESESRKYVRIARGLRLRSLRLGLIGRADVVEFHRLPDCSEKSEILEAELAPPGFSTNVGLKISKKKGLWKPFPVEYKRGKPKVEHCDTLQLCAQALCLEEMLDVRISDGALFYGQPQRRLEVVFSDELRTETERLASRMHELFRARALPPGRFDLKCSSCSLADLCLPKVIKKQKRVSEYLDEYCFSGEEGK